MGNRVFSKEDEKLMKQLLKAGNFKSMYELATELHRKWNKSTVGSIHFKLTQINRSFKGFSETSKPKPKTFGKIVTLNGDQAERVGIIEGKPLFKLGKVFFYIEETE